MAVSGSGVGGWYALDAVWPPRLRLNVQCKARGCRVSLPSLVINAETQERLTFRQQYLQLSRCCAPGMIPMAGILMPEKLGELGSRWRSGRVVS